MAEESGGGGNVLTRKVGPLPTWGWLAVITGAGIIYYLMNRNKAGATTAPASTAATTAAAAGVPQNVQVFQNYGKTPPVTPAPKPKPTAAPPKTQTATVGQLAGINSGSAPAWLFGSPGQAGGAYNSSGPNVGTVPIGASVTITGPAVTGAPAGNPASPSTIYYPVTYNGQSGYLSAANIVTNSIATSSGLSQGG